jgi:hypothetical protein
MWLLNTASFELHEFIGDECPKYAILSHRWGEEEVSFDDIVAYRHGIPESETIPKRGFSKIHGCCTQAAKDKLKWAWIDCCSIDKRSSADLSEAINSMFLWYKNASVCYVYLEDVEDAIDDSSTSLGASIDIANSQWFERGWTLQELLAPKYVTFFTRSWTVIGQKSSMEDHLFNIKLSKITGIPKKSLAGSQPLRLTSVAERMFWASRRKTTRPEDIAYSLMGLFNIHMPILYGEGLRKAFYRLQMEIIKTSADQSIFAWCGHRASRSCGLLARSPSDFIQSYSIVPSSLGLHDHPSQKAFVMTNVGMRLNLPLTELKYRGRSLFVAELMCHRISDGLPRRDKRIQLILSRAVALSREDPKHNSIQIHDQLFRRVMMNEFTVMQISENIAKPQEIFVPDDDQWNVLLQEADQRELILNVGRTKSIISKVSPMPFGN